MDKIREFKESHEENTLLYIVAAFVIGLAVGMLISPVKKGIAIGSYNGANNNFENSNNVSHKSGKRKNK